jgi:hypothetical protein
MKKIILPVFVIGALLMSSCNQRIIDFTVISSKNVTLRLPDDAKGKKVEGKDMVFCAPYCGIPNLKQAVDRAIENAGPGFDALIDGVVFNRMELFTSGYVVTGTPIKTTKLKSSE